MGFLKWYSIILMTLNISECLKLLVSSDELEERIRCLLEIVSIIPIIIYVFLK